MTGMFAHFRQTFDNRVEIVRSIPLKSRCAFLILFFFVAGSAASAEVSGGQVGNPLDLFAAGAFSIISVVDGDTVVLDDGREVRLTGIQAPKLPLGRPNFRTWPLAKEAKQAMASLSVGQSISFFIDGNDRDRYRRILAHLVRSDGVWLQGRMVEKGLARVYTFPDNHRMAAALLQKERSARAAKKGIWDLPYYAIRSVEPKSLIKDAGTFQLVAGTVLDVAKVRSRIYLNFGDDYRTDFTISIDRKAWPLFQSTGLDPLSLEDQAIRVRGWVKDFNGPLIDVSHPEQIEVLQ